MIFKEKGGEKMPKCKHFNRRPNNSGTIVKLSGKRRKPFCAKVTTGYDVSTGKQIQKSIGTFETWEEANLQLSLYTTTHHTNAEEATFNTVYLLWFEKYQEKVGALRVKQIDQVYNTHFDSIKLLPIEEVTLYKMQAIVDKLREEGRVAKVLQNIKFICCHVFEYAVIHQIIDRNKDFSQYIDTSTNTKDKNPHVALTREEISMLWTHSNDANVQIVLVAIYTGCRPNELFNLDWDKYQYEYFFGGSKTEAGRNRIIPIHSRIRPFFKKAIKYLQSYKTYESWKENRFKRLKYQYSMDHSFYDFRHTFSTIAKESGMSDNARAKIMGHKLGNITDDVYTHESIEYLCNEMEKFVV